MRLGRVSLHRALGSWTGWPGPNSATARPSDASLTETRNREPTLTVEEAAQLIGISRAQAYRCVERGELRGVKLGRRIVAVEELLGTPLAHHDHARDCARVTPVVHSDWGDS